MFEALLSSGRGAIITGVWANKTAGQENRAGGEGAVLEDKLYAFGGFDNSSFPATFKRYNPVSNAWETCANGPPGAWNNAMASAGGKIVLYGGSNSGGDLNRLWLYTPGTDTWVQKVGPANRVYAAAAGIGNKAYFCSGISGAGTPLLNCYDVVADSWTDLLPCPVTRYRHCMTAVGTKIYMYGGANLSTGNAVKDTWCYDTVANTWTQLADGPTARHSHMMATIGTKVYVMGGTMVSGTTDELWCYDPDTNVWSSLKASGYVRSDGYIGVIDGKLYVGSGNGPNGLSTVFQQYTP